MVHEEDVVRAQQVVQQQTGRLHFARRVLEAVFLALAALGRQPWRKWDLGKIDALPRSALPQTCQLPP